MPIRVRIERVGMYTDYPDKTIYDFKIERTDELDGELRKYVVGDQVIWHRNGDGVEALVEKALALDV